MTAVSESNALVAVDQPPRSSNERRAEALFGESLRRAVSVVVALAALVGAAPILMLLILLIRLDSPGAAIFTQKRVGLKGREFRLIKLRGMYVDARVRWPELYEYSYTQDEAASLRFHIDGDPRVTRVGRFIRRTSLDELPNLLNVLRGDMNLIGPRPEIPEMLPYYGTARDVILSVRPGVSSLAKVCGRDGLTLDETIELESDYVRRRSLGLDAKICLLTLSAVLRQHDMAQE